MRNRLRFGHLTVALGLSAALVAGCGSDETDEPRSSASPSVSASPSAEPDPSPSPADLHLSPGAVGPVQVGMSSAEASATGLFEVDVAVEDSPCLDVLPLLWKQPWRDQVDVIVLDDRVISMGVMRESSLTTDRDVALGATLAEVRAAYPEVSAPQSTGFNQSGVWVNDGDAWLGFLFDSPLDDLGDQSPVTFMEVARGERPALIRDGC